MRSPSKSKTTDLAPTQPAFVTFSRKYENMVVKTRKPNAKDLNSENRSQSGKSRRGKDGKGSAFQSKNGAVSGIIRNKLGLSTSAFTRGVTVLVLGKDLLISR